MKKLLTFFLVILVAFSAFAGGGQASQSQPSGTVAKGTLPLTKDNVTFTVFIAGLGNSVTSFSYNDNTFTKRIVDTTGIKLDFIAVSPADARTRLNAMLASSDYPDLLMKQDLSVGDLSYWGSQGVFQSLDNYNITSWPNIKAMMDEYPQLDKVIRGADGKIYGLPAVNDCLHCVYSYGRAYYYMPWARDNNKKLPETIAELTDYLRWIQNTDLNKNGKKDEIPIAFSADQLNQAVAYVAKAYMPFVLTANYTGLALNKGKVWEQYRENEFRQALATMASWYKEGLIAPNSFTMTADQARALAHNDDPLVGIFFANWSPARQPSDRWMELFQLKPVAGPAGVRYASNADPWSILKTDMIITTKCKNPELAVGLYDYLLNFDVQMEGYIGRKGEAWDSPDPGALSLMGGNPLYKILVTFHGQRINGSWDQYNPMAQTKEFRLGEQAKDVDIVKKWWATGDPSLRDVCMANGSYNEQNNFYQSNQMIPWAIPDEYFIPPVVLNDADNDRVSEINAVITPYQQLAWSEFITGRRDINSDTAWNAYLADLDRMGSKDLVTIYQKYIK